MTKKRTHSPAKEVETQKPAILAVAVALARSKGLFHFSRIEVANEADVGESTVSYHFGSMTALRKEVVREAIKQRHLNILADARSSREPLGLPMPEDLREEIAAFIKR